MDHSVQSLLEENGRLSEELAQCKADKEFVWLLWKQLQKQSPDMTATIDMVVTREKLKSDQRNQATLQAKDREISTLKNVVDTKQQEINDRNLRSARAESEVALLEKKLEAQQLQREKQTKLTKEAQVECEQVRERCRQLEEDNQQLLQNGQDMKQKVLRLEEEMGDREQLEEEHAGKERQIETLQKELVDLGSKMSEISTECSLSIEKCTELGQQLKSKQQQLAKARESIKSRDSEIKQLRDELSELRNSRDAWANHTTLQTSTVQKLQMENGQLKADVAAKTERLGALSKNLEELSTQLGELREQKSQYVERVVAAQVGEGHQHHGGEVVRLSQLLERTETELFETRAELEAKQGELHGLRSSHDRRLQRMQTLQTNHRLALQQLKTYESIGSPTHKKAPRPSSKPLRQEDSEAVWNELSRYKNRCQELESLRLVLEEDNDSLQARCLRHQTTITELRNCLQYEKDDLERKIDAIANMESTLSVSSVHEDKVAMLEGTVAQLQREKKELFDHYKNFESECYQRRQEAAKLQSTIMKLKHHQQLKKVKTLHKSTMTDTSPSEDSHTKDSSSIEVTDSATQVDLLSPIKHKPELRDAQVSPLYSWGPLAASSGTEPSWSSHLDLNYRATQSHHRSHSDGEVLLCKERARNALKSVHNLSRSLLKQSSPLRPQGEATEETNSISQEPSPAKKRKSTQPRPQPQGQLKRKSGRHVPHTCLCQQQVKSLQQRIKTLSKQVTLLSATKQSLSQSLEEERATSERARSEAKELNQRLQSYKTTVQTLQEDMQQLADANHQLQEKLSRFESERDKHQAEPERKGRSETEWKRLEAGQKVLSQKCSSLNETVKSLEEQLQIKTAELNSTEEKCVRMERDVKQKRHLIEDQRQKLKHMKETVSKSEEKMHTLTAEVRSLTETLDRRKHKAELFHSQLSKQTSEKGKLMEMLSSCQEELAHTLQQLSSCQEDIDRRKQVVVQTKQAFQQKITELQKDHSQRLLGMETQLETRGKVIEEFQQFTRTLAMELEQQRLARKKQQLYLKGKNGSMTAEAVSSRAREIARAALNLSDLELDDFFSEANAEPSQEQSFTSHVTSRITSKPPFAGELVKDFLNFLERSLE